MTSPDGRPILAFASGAEWREWLAREHGVSEGVWIRMAKKATRIPSVTHDQAVEVIASGAMEPAGLVEIERARADGRWDDAYEPPSTATVPADLQLALDADAGAAAGEKLHN